MQTNRFKLNADKTEVMIMSNKRSNPSSIALHPNEPEVDEADCSLNLHSEIYGVENAVPRPTKRKTRKPLTRAEVMTVEEMLGETVDGLL